MKNIKKILKDIISKLEISKEQLVVIKGFDRLTIERKIEASKIISNKMGYFLSEIYNKKTIITYDEYLMLYPIINMQYNKIIILENNIYMNYYPLNIIIDSNIIKELEDNFDEEKEGDKYEIGNISDYIDIYSNLKNINGEYYIIYNENQKSEKEQYIKLLDNKINEEGNIAQVVENIKIFELDEEEDYILLIEQMEKSNNEKVYVANKTNYITKTFFKEKLGVLKEIFIETDILKVSKKSSSSKKKVRDDYKKILKNYWGHENFRDIKIYDIEALDRREKKVVGISQEEIIETIVSETEKCLNNKDYRDIFITAPTGAGKSVMFQIPAIYLSEKDNEFLTIVISPLIGLMKDQVNNLEVINYRYARTINSDITPIQKQEIINDIEDKKCNILYISPETLLSRSDVEQLIGKRKLGLVVIDEAHIVTTWGKQFRPDYWYLGDHLNKIKKNQMKKNAQKGGFVIATFTATSIYGGVENMYEETIESLKMLDPITYLGYIKRTDLDINIKNEKAITNKVEYESDKFNDLMEQMDFAVTLEQKMLIYFPTVALINRFYESCKIKGYGKYISKYHGQLSGIEKEENYQKFLNKETFVMIATKAFGMGIDINDIEIVAHFAPTGNVCDYVQEIGRAARRKDLQGEAYYRFMGNDFKHINRLHGLSTLKEYQLIEVIKKVYELYLLNISQSKSEVVKLTKKRNEMLIDAESFSHIFENSFANEDDKLNKVKTAMLLIQKDFERRFSFSPFHVRPIPMFEIGYFKIDPGIQRKMIQEYGHILVEIDNKMHICSLNLKKLWEYEFNYKYSFPQFKYLIYTKSEEMKFKFINDIHSALVVDIKFEKNYKQLFEKYVQGIKKIINQAVRTEAFYSSQEIVESLKGELEINRYKAKAMTDILISSMSVYIRDFSRSTQAKAFTMRSLKNGEVKYKFLNGTSAFFRWFSKTFDKINNNTDENKMYLINEGMGTDFKQIIMVLGILESFELLVFKLLGGKNSQIYIYVNQTKTLREIKEKPFIYKNRLLDMIDTRHTISVEMLTYLYESKFSSEEIWALIENYFLGIIPKEVIKKYENKKGQKLEL
ncbi:DEAD/DEAH box helicase [Cetobacterium sp.]|uniref:DEAD/DEAH box helicase n=1 Tax=Cetobacterium sp. TaxID=2071632 RepID=UPI003F38E255